MVRSSLFETLESRTLLSASPVLFNSVILADRAHIRADINKFRADTFSSGIKLLLDLKRVHKLTPVGDTSLNASLEQLLSDSASLRTQLLADRQAEATNVAADEVLIKADIKQIHLDKGNDAALATDHTNLTNHRITLQNDILAALDARITTRQSFETTISTDTQAIVTAATNDSQATVKFTASVTKFSADRVTALNKLTADLQTISTARTKLVNDLTAAQST